MINEIKGIGNRMVSDSFLSAVRAFIIFPFYSCCYSSHIFRTTGRADEPRLFLGVSAEIIGSCIPIFRWMPFGDKVRILKTCRCTSLATDVSSHKCSGGGFIFMAVLTDPREYFV